MNPGGHPPGSGPHPAADALPDWGNSSGPAFADGVLTNWDLLSTSNWNFKALWLTVMNCCVLGKSIVVGTNPLGFISALHSVGSVASIAALWPVLDDAVIAIADHLGAALCAHFSGGSFPRARALSEAVESAMSDDQEKLWSFAPYALWGVPLGPCSRHAQEASKEADQYQVLPTSQAYLQG